ncbi:MAG: glucose 1-dehydrogenase [Burkholderiaceae bacterium]|nr:glucose 1-dehydrogenase [Burkholderiaceae bacterium]MEB2351312.1 SDR family NAD(P)-dependent oxidoreductase [Burkholderiaceae bacterium]
MKLNDSIAIVTGAASGIGLATAQALAQAGATVVLGDIADDKGEQAATALRAAGQRAEYLRCDVTGAASVNAFRDAVLARHGRVDIVANVAGWGKIQPFLENDDAFIERVVDLNFMGTLRVVRAFLPAMIERKHGKIVNVSSDAGRVGSTGETVYSGAKGGVIAFTKGLAREMARHNITANCVCPGPTDTPLLQAVPEKHREAFLRAIPMRRFAQPSDIADAVTFFASSRSDYVTGQVLSVSGGLSMVG